MPHNTMRRYTPRDYPLIAKWYEARGLHAPLTAYLSDMGYIADERVAGWIYITNSNLAIIEGIVADPFTLPSLRRASLRKLCATLVDKAVNLGYTNIIAITEHPSIERICEDMGFTTHSSLKVYGFEELE